MFAERVIVPFQVLSSGPKRLLKQWVPISFAGPLSSLYEIRELMAGLVATYYRLPQNLPTDIEGFPATAGWEILTSAMTGFWTILLPVAIAAPAVPIFLKSFLSFHCASLLRILYGIISACSCTHAFKTWRICLDRELCRLKNGSSSSSSTGTPFFHSFIVII